jgi:hypothetical protein
LYFVRFRIPQLLNNLAVRPSSSQVAKESLSLDQSLRLMNKKVGARFAERPSAVTIG